MESWGGAPPAIGGEEGAAPEGTPAEGAPAEGAAAFRKAPGMKEAAGAAWEAAGVIFTFSLPSVPLLVNISLGSSPVAALEASFILLYRSHRAGIRSEAAPPMRR